LQVDRQHEEPRILAQDCFHFFSGSVATISVTCNGVDMEKCKTLPKNYTGANCRDFYGVVDLAKCQRDCEDGGGIVTEVAAFSGAYLVVGSGDATPDPSYEWEGAFTNVAKEFNADPTRKMNINFYTESSVEREGGDLMGSSYLIDFFE
jgi:hypothetical protein